MSWPALPSAVSRLPSGQTKTTPGNSLKRGGKKINLCDLGDLFLFYWGFASPKMVRLLWCGLSLGSIIPVGLLCFLQAAGWAGCRPLLYCPPPVPWPVISLKMFLFFPRQMKLHGPFLPFFLEAKTCTREGGGEQRKSLLSTEEESADPARGTGTQSPTPEQMAAAHSH